MADVSVAGREMDDRSAVEPPPIDVTHVVIEVSLPDRPGALGAVASRIGAVGGDITDVVVSARNGGFADDVFHVDLPVPGVDVDVDIVGLVLEEISLVDGISAPSVSYRSDVDCCGDDDTRG